MFGYKLVKESDLFELQMHKRMSNELLDPLKPIWPFISDVRRLCRDPIYMKGIQQGLAHVSLNPGAREALTAREL